MNQQQLLIVVMGASASLVTGTYFLVRFLAGIWLADRISARNQPSSVIVTARAVQVISKDHQIKDLPALPEKKAAPKKRDV